jgi:hypothetical protein
VINTNLDRIQNDYYGKIGLKADILDSESNSNEDNDSEEERDKFPSI